MIIVTVQGFMKIQRIINPKRVYESEMYSKRVYDYNKPFYRVYYSTLFLTV